MTDTATRAPGALAPSPLPPLLGVVIVNHRGASDTIECLESLLRSALPMKLVVVENGSDDGSAEQLLAWAAGRSAVVAESSDMAAFSSPPVAKPVPMAELAADSVGGEGRLAPLVAPLTLIRSPVHLGFTGATNLGLRHLLADRQLKHFWLLGNDTVVAPDAAMGLLSRMMATPRVGLCGTVVRRYWEPDRIEALNGGVFNRYSGRSRLLGGDELATIKYSPQDVADATDFVLGTSLGVSRDFLTEVGLIDEAYALSFWELDWAARNARRRERAFETAFAHGATLFHKAGRSGVSGKARRSADADFEHTRSRLTFIWRHHRWLWPLHWALCWAQLPLRLLRQEGGNARAIVRAALGRGG